MHVQVHLCKTWTSSHQYHHAGKSPAASGILVRLSPQPCYVKLWCYSVAKKFLDDIELGSEAIRAAVVEFMPYSFAAVNAQSKRFLEVGLTAHCMGLGNSCAAVAASAPPFAGSQVFFSDTLVSLVDIVTCLCGCYLSYCVWFCRWRSVTTVPPQRPSWS